jgi:hypothetical protein
MANAVPIAPAPKTVTLATVAGYRTGVALRREPGLQTFTAPWRRANTTASSFE